MVLLSYNIKMPFSGVTDREIIGQLCYIIVKPAGDPPPPTPTPRLLKKHSRFPVSVSKLGSGAGSLSSAALNTLLDFFKSARIGAATAVLIFPSCGARIQSPVHCSTVYIYIIIYQSWYEMMALFTPGAKMHLGVILPQMDMSTYRCTQPILTIYKTESI